MESKRAYNWRIVTYCNEEEIIEFCKKWGTKWEYILHDRDVKEDGSKKENHYHINITLKVWKSRNMVCELVGKSGNSFAIEMTDKEKAHKYLTHRENPEKYQYEEKEIKSNFKWKENEWKGDNEEFINMVQDKTITLREKAIMFGRDFMKNYKKYKEYIEMIEIEEAEKNARGIRRVIEFIKEKATTTNYSIREILRQAIEYEEEIRNSITEIEEEAPDFERDITTPKTKRGRPLSCSSRPVQATITADQTKKVGTKSN